MEKTIQKILDNLIQISSINYIALNILKARIPELNNLTVNEQKELLQKLVGDYYCEMKFMAGSEYLRLTQKGRDVYSKQSEKQNKQSFFKKIKQFFNGKTKKLY